MQSFDNALLELLLQEQNMQNQQQFILQQQQQQEQQQFLQQLDDLARFNSQMPFFAPPTTSLSLPAFDSFLSSPSSSISDFPPSTLGCNLESFFPQTSPEFDISYLLSNKFDAVSPGVPSFMVSQPEPFLFESSLLALNNDAPLSPPYLSESSSVHSGSPYESPLSLESSPVSSPQPMLKISDVSPPDELPSSILASLCGTQPIKPRNTSEKIYSCPVPGCKQQFTRLFNLRAHGKTHDPTRVRPFQCDKCPKSFCRQHDLDRHATVHSKVKNFRCVYCARSFTRKDAMNRHIQVKKCHVLRAVDADVGVAAAVIAAVVASTKTA
ncbi:Metallothionein expression activator [Nowakowskiella sp. JEL0407]|nr:Metallothionein expression activator [Nowakowskiella sp. JEL0407]